MKGKNSFYDTLTQALKSTSTIKFNDTVWGKDRPGPELEECSMPVLRSLLGLSMQQEAKEEAKSQQVEERAALPLRELSSMKEEAFQTKYLNPWAVCHHGIDTHKSASGVDFKFPKALLEGEIFTNGAEPDITSTILPMWIEIKDTVGKQGVRMTAPDWEAMNQAVERVLSRMRLSAFARRAFCFAVTGFSAWLISGQRDDDMTIMLSITRMRHDDVEMLWNELAVRGADSSYFLNRDAAHIVACLSGMGFQAALCRVRHVATSMSSVFAVTPACSAAGYALGIPRTGQEAFALKVVHDQGEFVNEHTALREIATSPQAGSQFYALADRAPASTTGQVDLPEGWWNFERVQAEEGGAIIMRYADRTFKRGKNEDMREVVRGALHSLQLAHAVNVTQCDIRGANLAHFVDGGWQLIDFGRSGRFDTPYTLNLSSTQAKKAGQRIKALVDTANEATSGVNEVGCVWNAEDDYQMLVEFIMDHVPAWA
jgi:hypothetical protein